MRAEVRLSLLRPDPSETMSCVASAGPSSRATTARITAGPLTHDPG